jgi:hypothetical protein
MNNENNYYTDLKLICSQNQHYLDNQQLISQDKIVNAVDTINQTLLINVYDIQNSDQLSTFQYLFMSEDDEGLGCFHDVWSDFLNSIDRSTLIIRDVKKQAMWDSLGTLDSINIKINEISNLNQSVDYTSVKMGVQSIINFILTVAENSGLF